MRPVLSVGIGAGDPDHVTVQAIWCDPGSIWGDPGLNDGTIAARARHAGSIAGAGASVEIERGPRSGCA